ncbi:MULTISPECIES: CRISPR-associated protein Cas5 [Anoxybacillus]|nr:CRISPR-associated protein Cas5 [Anoxybacillus flavithermus]OAO81659.1 CRISPR-associated protein Cas5h family [Anoxybacillus flavithermus]
MKVVSFEVKGHVAHFRRPDTTATHLTYPFMSITAAKGLIGAIIGVEDFQTNDQIGIQIMSPVRTISQQLSMFGKEDGKQFNRPTTIELIVSPHYRIFYAGEEYVDALAEKLKADHCTYHTYLGVAYALTKPFNVEVFTVNEAVLTTEMIDILSVVPTSIVEHIEFENEKHLCRAGGFLRYYQGKRTFSHSLSFLYEKNGKPMTIQVKKDYKEDGFSLISHLGGYVCLI